jgi:thiol-disulfide isomerase/thioredoxin
MRLLSVRTVSFLVVVLACAPLQAQDPDISVIRYPQLLDLLREDTGDGVRVVNFWATWCRPCVAEMPWFESLPERIPQAEVIFVSFDQAEELDARVIPFLQRHNIRSKVLLLDETDFNAFIDLVDPAWSGAIPATIFIGRARHFHEGELTQARVDEIVRNLLLPPSKP